MIFEYKQDKYKFEFHHTPYNPEFPDALRSTECYLFQEFDGAWRMVAEGWADCTADDNFCKETGRKVALTRTLRSCPDKQFKRTLWNVYLTRKALAAACDSVRV